MRLAEFFERLYVPPVRRLRAAFRYVTGNGTRLAFARACGLLVVIGAGLNAIVALREDSIGAAAWHVIVMGGWLVFLGPYHFRRAAEADTAPLGPRSTANPVESIYDGIVTSVFLVLVSFGFAVHLLELDLLAVASNLCWTAFVPIVWLRGSGKDDGQRTLARDVRRLAEAGRAQVLAGAEPS